MRTGVVQLDTNYASDSPNNELSDVSELEIMAKSGFLSIVGVAHIPHGSTKHEIVLPQQPTNTLIFYYVHSLMAVN